MVRLPSYCTRTSLILHHSNKIYAASYMVIKLNVLGGILGKVGLVSFTICLLLLYSSRRSGGEGEGGGDGVAGDVQPSGPPSVCPHFVSEGKLGNP